MSEKNHNMCELILDYVSGVCTIEDIDAFEHHLSECHECQAELRELQMIWRTIPIDMDPIQPPKDLKQKVLEEVTGVSFEPKPFFSDQHQDLLSIGSQQLLLYLP
jgi:hypothetical protein